jgi:hypothetical protein
VRLSGSSSLGADAGITGFSLSSRRSGSHQLRPSSAGCLGGCEVRRPSRHPNRPHRQLVWPDDADRPRMLNSRPELPIPNAAAQTRIVSVARIRLDSWKSVRPFKEIFCDDIWEFEPYLPSQPVRSPEANMRTPLKTARYRGNAIIGRLAASYRWRHSWQHAIESHTATNGGFIPVGRRSRVVSRSHSGTLDIRPAVRRGRERRRKIVVATRAAKRPFQRAQAIGRRGAGPAFCGYPP